MYSFYSLLLVYLLSLLPFFHSLVLSLLPFLHFSSPCFTAHKTLYSVKPFVFHSEIVGCHICPIMPIMSYFVVVVVILRYISIGCVCLGVFVPNDDFYLKNPNPLNKADPFREATIHPWTCKASPSPPSVMKKSGLMDGCGRIHVSPAPALKPDQIMCAKKGIFHRQRLQNKASSLAPRHVGSRCQCQECHDMVAPHLSYANLNSEFLALENSNLINKFPCHMMDPFCLWGL